MNQDIRLCSLQVCAGPGAWRTVMDFEVEDADDVMNAAEKLLDWGFCKARKVLQLRIMKPGDPVPMATWCKNEEWIVWATEV